MSCPSVGVTRATRFVGTPGSYTYLHIELNGYPSINILLAGEPKLWVFVWPEDTSRLSEEMENARAREVRPWSRSCPARAVHKPSSCYRPDDFEKLRVRYSYLIQQVGDLVFVNRDVPHQVINLGYNMADAKLMCTKSLFCRQRILSCSCPKRTGELKPHLHTFPNGVNRFSREKLLTLGIEPPDDRLNLTALDNLVAEGGVPLTNLVGNSSPDGTRGVEDHVLIADNSVHVPGQCGSVPESSGESRPQVPLDETLLDTFVSSGKAESRSKVMLGPVISSGSESLGEMAHDIFSTTRVEPPGEVALDLRIVSENMEVRSIPKGNYSLIPGESPTFQEEPLDLSVELFSPELEILVPDDNPVCDENRSAIGSTESCSEEVVETYDSILHSSVKDRTCPHCDRQFKKRFLMVRHVDSVHNKKKVRCSICAKEVSARYAAEHQKTAHGGTDPLRLKKNAKLRESRAKRKA